MLKAVCIMLGVAVNALPTDIELTPNGRGTNFATVGGSSPTVCGVDPSTACSPSSITESANCVTPNSAVEKYVSPTGTTQLLGFVNDGAKGSDPNDYDRICSDFGGPQHQVNPPGAGGIRNYAVTQCNYGPGCPVYRIFDEGAVAVGDDFQLGLQGTVPTFLEEGSPAFVGVGAHECGQWWSFEKDVVDSSPSEIFSKQAVCNADLNQWWRNTSSPTGEPASKGTVINDSAGWIVRCLMGGSTHTTNAPYVTVGQTQVANCLTNCDEKGMNCDELPSGVPKNVSIGVGSDILQVSITAELLLTQGDAICHQCKLAPNPNDKVTEACPINYPFSQPDDKWKPINFVPIPRTTYCQGDPA